METTRRAGEMSRLLLIRGRIEEAIHLLNEQEWIVQLLIRVFIGYFFMETGWGKLHNLDDFVELDEPLYALTYLWLLISGPGWVSVDYLISRAYGLNAPATKVSAVTTHDRTVLKHDAVTVR